MGVTMAHILTPNRKEVNCYLHYFAEKMRFYV